MQVQILALGLGGHRRQGRALGHAQLSVAIGQDGELLEHEADVLVLGDQVHQGRQGGLAVGAAVVEELHHRDLALGIGHEVARVAFQVCPALEDDPARGLLGLGFLQRLRLLHGLLDHLGMSHQIGAHLIAKGVLAGGLGAAQQGQDGHGGQQQGLEVH